MADDSLKHQEFLQEALDRVHMVSNHLQMAIGDHPSIENDQALNDIYEQAVEAIETLYQNIGRRIEPDPTVK
ncbi:MAG: hypothetical protein AAF226_14370 [Verrucomicrobiota bacterium]